ncbi:MAG: RluA family pseudouridine synthase [Methylovirgula sp.]
MAKKKTKDAETAEPSKQPIRAEPAHDALADEVAEFHSFHFVVAEEEVGERLDRFLAGRPEAQEAALSRTRLKNLIEEGAVTLDGAPVLDAGVKLRRGGQIVLTVPPAADPLPRGEKLPLNIVYEDADLIVIDKPAGLVVHPAPGHESGTLVNALIAHCGEALSGIGGVRRPGIVHRLDKDTSGLLVVAKNDRAHQGLAALFADHGRSAEDFTRDYLAFAWGVPRDPSGTIDAPIFRHKTDREKMAVSPQGREAITHWEVLETFAGHNGQPVASLIRCSLETGRTHQIRVHLAHLGHPLLGDTLYGSGFKTKLSLLSSAAQAELGGLRRQALHAAVLGFAHPVTGKRLRFESAPPEDLRSLHASLEVTK